MKELSIEEKAKRYDAALKVLHKYDGANIMFTQDLKEEMFPELKESEDERISKALIYFIKQSEIKGTIRTYLGVTEKEMFAWLEKQYADPIKEYWRGYNEGKQCVLDKYAELEKQGGHKPDDKAEPKFHKGEWITHQGTENIYQVVAVIDNQYQLKYGDNYTKQYCEDVDRCARLWTIQDAKDGDVLATKAGDIFIYKELLYDKPFAYCGIDKFGVFKDCNCGDGLDWTPYLSDVTPATKEQCNILEKAMADAGYTFDFKKKELKKIEPKPADKEMKELLRTEYEKGRADAIAEMQKPWSEEDERNLKSIMKIIKEKAFADYDVDEDNNMLGIYGILENWLKDRVQIQPMQEWSEEDSPYYDDICEMLINLLHSETADVNKGAVQKDLDWFISLKPQSTWKPSDEQMITLRHVISGCSYDIEPLAEIEEHLKKLREEDV